MPKAVYNLVPRPGQAGLIGFIEPLLNSAPIFTDIEGRTEGDYGLEFTVSNINHVFGGVSVVEEIFWGVPADPANDPLRLKPVGCTVVRGERRPPMRRRCQIKRATEAVHQSLRRSADSDLQPNAVVESYDHGFRSGTASSSPATTGCDQLSFNPSLFAQPTTNRTDTASGLDIDLKVPAAESPISPVAVGDQSRDRDPARRASRSTRAPPTARPPAPRSRRKSGSGTRRPNVRRTRRSDRSRSRPRRCRPRFRDSSTWRNPKPGDPYRLYLIADGFGVHVKLPGGLDRSRSRHRAARRRGWKDLPQFPFNEFNLHLFGSERGLLATPDRCGTYAVDSTFTPWDSLLPDQTSTQFFELNEGPNGTPCPGQTRGFNPSFRAGVADRGAGVHSPFTFDATRPDGDQNAVGLNVDTPPGFTASLRGVPYCPEAAIAQLQAAGYSGRTELAAPACPQASQVGDRRRRSRRRNPSGLRRGQGLPRRPLQGRSAEPRHRRPGGLGAVRPRQHRRPHRGQRRRGNRPGAVRSPTRFRRWSKGSRFAPVTSGSISTGQGFTLNPTNCDPFAVDSVLLRRRRGCGQPQQLLPGRELLDARGSARRWR